MYLDMYKIDGTVNNDTDSSFDNELFDISLEKADSSKMQTLGMMP